jgi:hypothetical protein
MQHFLKLTFLAAFAVSFLSCSTGKKIDPKDRTLSMVFGYFDMKDAPSNVEWVSIKKYDMDSSDEYVHAGVQDGIFWHVGVKPGSYQVDTFGGVGGVPMLTQQNYSYNFGSKGKNETAVRIKSPGIYFLGSYKYAQHKDGFEMKTNATAKEKDILKKLKKIFEEDKELRVYAHQIGLMKRKLASE